MIERVVEDKERRNREHAGHQRSDTAKRSMAIHAEMRQEIEHLRRINAELLEELKQMVERFKRCLLHTKSAGDEEIAESAVSKARQIIAKAEDQKVTA